MGQEVPALSYKSLIWSCTDAHQWLDSQKLAAIRGDVGRKGGKRRRDAKGHAERWQSGGVSERAKQGAGLGVCIQDSEDGGLEEPLEKRENIEVDGGRKKTALGLGRRAFPWASTRGRSELQPL